MQYKDKLKDPRWIEFRKRVYKKDKYKCVTCGTKDRPLNAHHKVYRQENKKHVEPWDYSVDDMKTLCESCHSAEHKRSIITIIDKKTNLTINEDEPTRRTRLAVEKQLKVDRQKRKGESNA